MLARSKEVLLSETPRVRADTRSGLNGNDGPDVVEVGDANCCCCCCCCCLILSRDKIAAAVTDVGSEARPPCDVKRLKN